MKINRYVTLRTLGLSLFSAWLVYMSGLPEACSEVDPMQSTTTHSPADRGQREAEEFAKHLGEYQKPPKRGKRRSSTVGENKKYDYTGFVGNTSINASLKVYRGKAEGELHFLRDPTQVYTITGQYSREEYMELVLKFDSAPVATVQIKEKPRSTAAVQWSGTLRNKDGERYDFFLVRLLKVGPPRARPPTIAAFDALSGFETYTGKITDSQNVETKAFFKLKFERVECHGFYYQRYQNGTTSSVLGLDGANPSGVLTLRESDWSWVFGGVLFDQSAARANA